MNHALVVDASVAVKWVVREANSDRALRLWLDSMQVRRPVFVPPHFTGEVTNAIYRRQVSTDASKRLSPHEADAALTQFLQYPVQPASPPDVYRRAYDLAIAHNLPSIYDSLYVVLAQMLNVELWTADERLLRALTGRAQWVRFIGTYPMIAPP